MKHRSTRALFNYWNSRRDGARAPSRAAIEPSDIHTLLSDTFVLECDRDGQAPFRLAGTRACVLFKRELRGYDFGSLWDERNRDTITAAIRVLRNEASCCVIGWRGRTARNLHVSGEAVLLPLTIGGTQIARILGTLVTFDLPYWLGSDPVIDLELRSIRMVSADDQELAMAAPGLSGTAWTGLLPDGEEPPPVLHDGGRKVGHLSVYEGGLSRE